MWKLLLVLTLVWLACVAPTMAKDAPKAARSPEPKDQMDVFEMHRTYPNMERMPVTHIRDLV